MKPKLTKESIKEICDLIGSGLSNKDAISVVGVGESAFYGWIKRGNKEIAEGAKPSLYSKLVQSLKKANANFKKTHLDNISKASSSDWKASAWILERKYPNEYGKIVRTQIEEDIKDDDDDINEVEIVFTDASEGMNDESKS